MRRDNVLAALLGAGLMGALACDDKPGSAGGSSVAEGLVSIHSGERTIRHASCEEVKVADNGTITVKGKDGLEIVVDDEGTIVSSNRDLKFRDDEGDEKVYVASSKKLVSEDVYLGDKGKSADEAEADDGDGDVVLTSSDDDGDGSEVTICHVPPGNPANQHTLTVGASAVKAHLGHGDYEGPCDGRDVGSKPKGKGNAGKGKGKGKGSKGKGKP